MRLWYHNRFVSLKNILENNYQILFRVFLGINIVFLNFVLSATVTPVVYGNIALLIYIIKSSTYSGFGVTQGFIYFALREREKDYFYTYFAFYFFTVLLVVFLLGEYFNIYASLLLLILFGIFLFEPFLKTRKNYYLVYFPEVILLLSFLTVSFISPNDLQSQNYQMVLLMVLLGTILVISFQIKQVKTLLIFSKKRLSFKRLGLLLNKGQGVYFFSILFITFMLIDRHMYKEVFGGDVLGVVMLALNFVLASQFLVTTLNASSVVELGEELKLKGFISKKHLKAKLKKSFMLGFTFYVLFGFIVYFLKDIYFEAYLLLFEVYLIVGAAMIIYNVYSSVSNTLFFYSKTLLPVSLFLLLNVFVLLNLFFLSINVEFIEALTINFVGLSVCSMVLIFYVYHFALNKKGYNMTHSKKHCSEMVDSK